MSSTNCSTKESVDFYFAYLSPYSFLANNSIENILGQLGVSINYLPVAHMGPEDGPNFSPARYRYICEEDLPRYAKELNVTFTSYPPLTESYTASSAFLYAQEKGLGKNLNAGIFAARWSFGLDISSEKVLGDIAVDVGLDKKAMLTAIRIPKYRQQLSKIHEKKNVAGVFGAPTFIYKGQRFWGNDRVDFFVKAIKSQKEISHV